MESEIKKKSIVSVVIPVFNESEFLPDFLNSLLCQDYPADQMEYIFVDGISTDDSVQIINRTMEKTGRNYRITTNPNRTAPYAMNIGIKAAKGDIIVRLDVHSEYPDNYVSKCVYYLQNTDAANVGCPRLIRGKGFWGECIEQVYTSRFGVGASSYRLGNSGYKEINNTEYTTSVSLGTFYRSLFEKIGYFDVRYPRAEDNEINYRIRKSGRKVLLFKDIHTIYYSRSSVSGFIKMAYGNGLSIGRLYRGEPKAVGIKYLPPALFVISLAIGSVVLCGKKSVLKMLFLLEIFIYGTLDIYSCITSDLRLMQKLVTLLLFPAFHISYGIGIINGFRK